MWLFVPYSHTQCKFHSHCHFFIFTPSAVPVVTVSMESVTVAEGGSFSLSCSSSVPGLDVRWRPPFGAVESPNVFIDGLNLMVVNATMGEEGDYTCVVLEMGEATIASASATVDVLISKSNDCLFSVSSGGSRGGSRSAKEPHFHCRP